MTMFSPSASYHAELRQELDAFGRALALQRVLTWGSRGLVLGLLVDLGLLAWAWTREAVWMIPPTVLVAAPLGLAILLGIVPMFHRQPWPALARRVDAAAGLQERATTALELGANGVEHPLAVAQMRDAVEHIKRMDALSTFPLRAPRSELVGAVLAIALGAAILFAPNPWAIARARANNPAAVVAKEQAQRVERLADSLQADAAAEIQDLRNTLKRGAQVVDSRSGAPEDALGALEDLEERIRQMSAGDDQMASALAAVAGALAGDQSTQDLAQAINTGDLREVSKASRSLADRTEQMNGQERERVARTLKDAANRAGRSSPQLQSQLSEAADALAQGSQGAGDSASQSASGQRSGQSGSNGAGRSAREALNDMANSAAGAAERQRAQGQLESSRNALERALGRSQSRSGASQGSRSSSRERGQRGLGEDARSTGEGESGGQSGESGGGGQDGQGGEGSGENAGGSGYGTGSSGQQLGGGVTGIDTVTRPEQVGSAGGFAPDETTDNPYLGEGADATSQAADEQVSPSYARRTTQGGDSGSIPLGLRDLVKDYFSSLDQK